MRTPFLAAALAFGLGLWGCGDPGEGAASKEAAKNKAANTAPQQQGGIVSESKTAGGEVVNDPSQVQAGGSYRIKPANPDDPKFKPDPRIAGGG